MSIKIGDKVYLNLEEQVYKNVSDIENLFKYARATLKIVGKVTSSANLPDPTTYTGNPGDVYQVGASAPFTYYAFTGSQWISIGQIKGDKGDKGDDGDLGPAPTIIIGDITTTTVEPTEDANVEVTAEQVDDVVTLDWDFEIPKGAKGDKGDTGDAGEDGVGINTMTNVSDNVFSNRVISVEYDPDNVPFGFGFNQTNRYTYTGGSKTVSSYVEVPIAPVEDELEYTRATDHKNGDYYQLGISQAFKDDQEEMMDNKIDAIDDFVEKTTSKNRVYVTNASGQQSIHPYSIDATNNSFAVRGSDATLKVGTPTDDAHAATKKYVDDSTEPKHTITSILYTLSEYTPDENNIIELDIGTDSWRHIWGLFSSTVPEGTKWYVKSGAAGVTPQKQTKVNYAVIDINYLPIPGAARPYRVIESTIGGSANQFSSVVASTEYLTLNTLCIELPTGVSPAGTLRLVVEV